MTNNLSVCGHKVKRAFVRTGYSPEKAVALAQDVLLKHEDGTSLSLSGLMKIFRGELPQKNPEKILEALAEVFHCSVDDFAESEAKAS